MNFLVDAQLPLLLVRLLHEWGHDATHTSALPNANRSTDTEIATMADNENQVVVSKDRDFRNSHLLQGTPRRLLAVRTGNISNRELIALFDANIEQIVGALEEASFVEIGPNRLIVHDDKSD